MRRLWSTLAGIGLVMSAATPAQACLSCGCGGTGAAADLGAVGGASSMFSMGQHWLLQAGTSVRGISGSFNERGDWNPTPVGGSLTSVSTSLGLMYFPTMGTSVSLQMPVIANALDGASWGPMGSISPTDLPRTSGAAVGDLAMQASMKLLEGDQWALAGWGGATLPTGNATGDAARLSGSGVASGQLGFLGLTQLDPFELSLNLGYQRPFARPPIEASSFYVGEAWLYQLQGNVRVSDDWRVGLGVNGYAGLGRFGANDLGVPMHKVQVMPSVQLALGPSEGFRLALGVDPALLGANALTDTTASLVFYQFIP